MVDKIYHFALIHDKNSVINNGLQISLTTKKTRKIYSDTNEINTVLNMYKPQTIPETINREECLFFFPEIKPGYDTDICIGFKVKITDLNIDQLYVANHEVAHRIWCDVVDAPYSGIYSGIPLEQSAKEYWESIIPFKDYILNPNIPLEDVELLYFDNILKDKLKVI